MCPGSSVQTNKKWLICLKYLVKCLFIKLFSLKFVNSKYRVVVIYCMVFHCHVCLGRFTYGMQRLMLAVEQESDTTEAEGLTKDT